MLVIGNKKYRNLQEQVGWNTEQIEKIFEFLDGLNVEDNLIKLDNASGTLTAEEMEIVSRDVALIIYNDDLYIKTETSASEYIFKQVALNASDNGTYNILQSFRIVVTRASGAYAYSANTVLTLYNKSEADALLGAKADTSTVNASLALKANLSGANFTGAITSPSIIEDMTGYSWTNGSTAVVPTYSGVVKNGNKVTFVIAGTITPPTISTLYELGIFTIPAELYNKLYPIQSSDIAYPDIALMVSYANKVNGYGTVEKVTGNKLRFQVYVTSAATANQTYYFRVEVTFLLSDNLAS